MGYLGNREAVGTTGNPANPFGATKWTVEFSPRIHGFTIDFEIYHIALKGPAPSQFQVYIDTTFYDNVVRGDVNSWDPSNAMHVQRGRTVFFYYNTSATPAPRVNIFAREPSPI